MQRNMVNMKENHDSPTHPPPAEEQLPRGSSLESSDDVRQRQSDLQMQNDLHKQCDQERALRRQLEVHTAELQRQNELLVKKAQLTEVNVERAREKMMEMSHIIAHLQHDKGEMTLALGHIQQDKTLLVAELNSYKAQASIANDKTVMYNILMERARKMEEENSSLVLENEMQLRHYERIVHELSQKVSKELAIQEKHKAHMRKIKNNVRGMFGLPPTDDPDAAGADSHSAAPDSAEHRSSEDQGDQTGSYAAPGASPFNASGGVASGPHAGSSGAVGSGNVAGDGSSRKLASVPRNDSYPSSNSLGSAVLPSNQYHGADSHAYRPGNSGQGAAYDGSRTSSGGRGRYRGGKSHQIQGRDSGGDGEDEEPWVTRGSDGSLPPFDEGQGGQQPHFGGGCPRMSTPPLHLLNGSYSDDNLDNDLGDDDVLNYGRGATSQGGAVAVTMETEFPAEKEASPRMRLVERRPLVEGRGGRHASVGSLDGGWGQQRSGRGDVAMGVGARGLHYHGPGTTASLARTPVGSRLISGSARGGYHGYQRSISAEALRDLRLHTPTAESAASLAAFVKCNPARTASANVLVPSTNFTTAVSAQETGLLSGRTKAQNPSSAYPSDTRKRDSNAQHNYFNNATGEYQQYGTENTNSRFTAPIPGGPSPGGAAASSNGVTMRQQSVGSALRRSRGAPVFDRAEMKSPAHRRDAPAELPHSLQSPNDSYGTQPHEFDPFSEDADSILAKHQSLVVVGSHEDLFDSSRTPSPHHHHRSAFDEPHSDAKEKRVDDAEEAKGAPPKLPPRPPSRADSEALLTRRSESVASSLSRNTESGVSALRNGNNSDTINYEEASVPPPLPPKSVGHGSCKRKFKPLPKEPTGGQEEEEEEGRSQSSNSFTKEVSSIASEMASITMRSTQDFEE